MFVTGAPPEYPGGKHEAPIDMRLRSRPAPPPYTRPSVITKSNDTPPGKHSCNFRYKTEIYKTFEKEF